MLVIAVLCVVIVGIIGGMYLRRSLPASVWMEVQAAAQAILNALQTVVHEDDVRALAGYIYDETVLHSIISRQQFQGFVWDVVRQIISSEAVAIRGAGSFEIPVSPDAATRSFSYSQHH